MIAFQKKIIKSRVNIFDSKESSSGPCIVLFILILLILEEHLIDYETDCKAALPAFLNKKYTFISVLLSPVVKQGTGFYIHKMRKTSSRANKSLRHCVYIFKKNNK